MRTQLAWACFLVLSAGMGDGTAQPGQAPPGLDGPAQPSDFRKALTKKVEEWLEKNNSFGPDHKYASELAEKVGVALSKAEGFSLTLGSGLVKGKKPVVLAGWGGELFVFEVVDAAAVKSLNIGENTSSLTSFSSGKPSLRAEHEAKLATLVVADAKKLQGDQKITGSLACKRLKDGKKGATSLVRLTALAGKWVRTCEQDLNGPIPEDDQALAFDFPPINTDGVKHSGPMLVFLEVCSRGKAGEKASVVSNPVAALVFVAGQAGEKRPAKMPDSPAPEARSGEEKSSKEVKDPLKCTRREWDGGTYVTFDGWPVAEVPNGIGALYATCPPKRKDDFNLLLLVATPKAQDLARMFELGPQLVKATYPHLERKEEPPKCTFGGDEARLERYAGEWNGKKVFAQAIYIRKKDVAVIVFGIGTEAGFKEFGRATEIVAQSLSFKESRLEEGLVGTWTYSKGTRREISSGNRVNASTDITVTIYPNGTFTEYTQGYVDATAKLGGYDGSANWVKEGRGRGRIVKRGNVLTFHYDDGSTWSGPYKLEGGNGLRLGTSLYIR